ncbi:MAG: tRNA (adenosine(37)-N6)-threonylcarbamoyltransferase complex ATPase subunit type 1 TsaE [Hymenobacteraceae bacterium]|mgnify:CR=1 FL=1|nr:tRNA (adenosine(37)-N6)-threonylcarbamoyltransferase complex ATPase subunit type 1 TsaE [Hymenobacteraceae bacterium]MDX5396670.1 tRNA (adenosine(37)-N6)-threonylcarbamoyltransferase complex ATPase subunit type 1 TsaE [Hymenobacteraceae bacterium]MDX5512733.1 tRNA (adenosine(37)-N6)-threonylcarbamoyltransferase complex ATPase subunit type 1 TsaE [Hymenobacteraceae bacterium]
MLKDTEPLFRVEVKQKSELPQAAKELLRAVGDEKVLAFDGPMGAGKTTFIKEICSQLGVTDTVTSPTFGLVNEYESGAGHPIYHFDFYRITDEKEALNMGVLEYFDSGHLCLIEWPVKVENLLPEHYLLVKIEPGEGENRTITLNTI